MRTGVPVAATAHSPEPAKRQASIGGKRTRRRGYPPVRWTAKPLGYEPERARRHEVVATATLHNDNERRSPKVRVRRPDTLRLGLGFMQIWGF